MRFKRLITRWIKRKLGIYHLQQQVMICKSEAEQARASSKKSEMIIRERTSIDVDACPYGSQPSKVILSGKYKNVDYVRIFRVDDRAMVDLIEQLISMERHAMVARVDMPPQYREQFNNEFMRRRR